MNKKGPVLLLLALLAGLPGCGPEKAKQPKKAPAKKMRMAQSDEFTDMSMPLADADDEMTDDSLKSFFNEMEEEFVAFNDDFDADEMTDDQLRWDDSDNVSTLETVYFEFGKDSVDEDQDEKIEFNAEQAKQLLAEANQDDSELKVRVDGYACPSAGTAEYNDKLSLDRANAVADQLVAHGISRDSIEVKHHGSKNPVLKEGSRDEQWVNRRVELHVV